MLLLCFIALRDWHTHRFLISLVDIKTQTKNPRKRNSPLNMCVGGIRLEGCMLYLTCIFTYYLLHGMCIMHTCIAYSSCIILTPCFAAIIDSSGSFCVLENKGGRLVRTIPSPYSIATTHTVEEMEQQEGKWFMNNLRAMIQDELKQALAGLIPLPAVETTLVTDIV